MSQYTVTIGKGVCVIVELEEGQIVCQPPLQKPELGIVSVQGQPQVKVSVTCCISILRDHHLFNVIIYLKLDTSIRAVRVHVTVKVVAYGCTFVCSISFGNMFKRCC
jgi:hypothetical protein